MMHSLKMHCTRDMKFPYEVYTTAIVSDIAVKILCYTNDIGMEVKEENDEDKMDENDIYNKDILVEDREISNDENMLPIHFLPEGRPSYDWIKNDLENSTGVGSLVSYTKQMQNGEGKMKTKSIDSITYSRANMKSSVGILGKKDDLHLLLKASEEGDLQMLKLILNKSPTLINLTDSDGYTALHRASYSAQADVLIYLIEHGGNVNAKTHDGWQPIHCAARWNNLHICQILLDHKADINAVTNGMQSPLHFAALSEENVNILEMFLLNPNINVDVINAAGDTPYDLAQRNGPQVQLFDLVHEGLKI